MTFAQGGCRIWALAKPWFRLPGVSASFGVVGGLAKHFFPRRYFIKFLLVRNGTIRRVAQCPTDEWRHYQG